MSFSPQKLKAAKCAAAAAAYGLLASGALLEFGTFTPDLTLFPVLSHTQKIGKFLRFLEESDFSDAPNIVNFDFLAESFLSLNRRPGDVYILSDFFGESDSFRKDFAAGFDLLRQAGFPPRVIHLTAPSDRAENLVGDVDIFDPSRDYRQIITLTERDLAAYQRLYDAYIAEVEAFCSQRKIPYTRISSGSPLDVLCFTALGLPEASVRVNPWREYITP